MNTKNFSSVRVRFAPSPTGHLHIGGLRAAIFNWLFARHNNGVFLLRIEDTDLERSKEEYTQSILGSFNWMGITADEPIMIQSSRVAEHNRVARQLVEEGKAYYCFCSQEEVAERYKQRMGTNDAFVKYDGKCRDIKPSPQELESAYVIRFALPKQKGTIAWHDLIRGDVSFEIDQFDDFIIIRSDRMSMYNFAVVVDDAFMKISHVVRGEDHVSNTPKQIMIYQACGYALPEFAHLPMILGPSGDRLSKRDGATSVLEYKNLGYLPDALFNYLVRLGWSHGDQEIFSREELIQLFSLEQVNKKASIFDYQKLDWLNGMYIRATSNHDLHMLIIRDVMPDFESYITWDAPQIEEAIGLYKERVKTLSELAKELIALQGSDFGYNNEDMQKWVTPATLEHLNRIIETFDATPDFSASALNVRIKELAEILGVKLVNLAQPIRLALVGKSTSPGVFELLALVGRDESKRRLQRLRDFLMERTVL